MNSSWAHHPGRPCHAPATPLTRPLTPPPPAAAPCHSQANPAQARSQPRSQARRRCQPLVTARSSLRSLSTGGLPGASPAHRSTGKALHARSTPRGKCDAPGAMESGRRRLARAPAGRRPACHLRTRRHFPLPAGPGRGKDPPFCAHRLNSSAGSSAAHRKCSVRPRAGRRSGCFRNIVGRKEQRLGATGAVTPRRHVSLRA